METLKIKIIEMNNASAKAKGKYQKHTFTLSGFEVFEGIGRDAIRVSVKPDDNRRWFANAINEKGKAMRIWDCDGKFSTLCNTKGIHKVSVGVQTDCYSRMNYTTIIEVL